MEGYGLLLELLGQFNSLRMDMSQDVNTIVIDFVRFKGKNIGWCDKG